MASSVLLGKGAGEMNLAQLRTRADDLRRTLDQLINLLQFAPEKLTWTEALDRFTVVNVQYQQLQDQLRPMLRHWVAHPKSVNQANAATLPIMLATKLLPEMEAEQEELLQQLSMQQQGLPTAAIQPTGPAAAAASAGASGAPLPVRLDLQLVKQRCEAWNAKIEALEGLVSKASQQRKEAQAAAALGAAGAAGAGAAGTAAAAAGGAGGELQGPELLLAAASYGAGL